MLGKWAPPHGRCEASDDSEEAGVIRETLEETGLHVRPIKKLLTQPADTKVKTVSFWLVELVDNNEVVKLDPTESSQFLWCDLDEALELPLYPGTKLFFEKVKKHEISL